MPVWVGKKSAAEPTRAAMIIDFMVKIGTSDFVRGIGEMSEWLVVGGFQLVPKVNKSRRYGWGDPAILSVYQFLFGPIFLRGTLEAFSGHNALD